MSRGVRFVQFLEIAPHNLTGKSKNAKQSSTFLDTNNFSPMEKERPSHIKNIRRVGSNAHIVSVLMFWAIEHAHLRLVYFYYCYCCCCYLLTLLL